MFIYNYLCSENANKLFYIYEYITFNEKLYFWTKNMIGEKDEKKFNEKTIQFIIIKYIFQLFTWCANK